MSHQRRKFLTTRLLNCYVYTTSSYWSTSQKRNVTQLPDGTIAACRLTHNWWGLLFNYDETLKGAVSSLPLEQRIFFKRLITPHRTLAGWFVVNEGLLSLNQQLEEFDWKYCVGDREGKADAPSHLSHLTFYPLFSQV